MSTNPPLPRSARLGRGVLRPARHHRARPADRQRLQLSLYSTQISAGSLNVTAYAVKTPSGNLNLVIVNKDLAANLQVTTQLPQSANSATLIAMTQLTSGAGVPELTATSGITIQGASVNPDSTFAPAAAYTLQPSGSRLTYYVPALSAVLIQVL